MAQKPSKTGLQKLGSFYVTVGVTLTFIRSACLFSWAIWHLFTPAVMPDGHPMSYLGTLAMAALGTVLISFLWPLGILAWALGYATLASVVLFPWFV